MTLATPIRIAVIAKHVALAVALTASAALFIDYKNAGDPAFCGATSGCFAVRVSAYSHVLGIPLPNLALPAFAVLLAGSLLARSAEQHRLVTAAAGLGGVFAVALIAIQAFAVGAFCPWCVAVDSAAFVCGAASLALWQWIGTSDERARAISVRGPAAAAWGLAGALAIGLPFVWARYPVIPAPPAEIASELSPGKVTVVSFTDFECPFCRKLHPVLDEARKRHGERLHFVRKMKPLSGHAGALPAARAWICTPEPKRDAAADALYAMAPADFSEKKLAGLAEKLGLGEREAFVECMRSTATEEVIERDGKAFARASGHGLPLTWVNGRAIMGYNPERVVASIEAEMNGPQPAIPLGVLLGLLGVTFAIAAFVSWRALSAPNAPVEGSGPSDGDRGPENDLGYAPPADAP